MKKTEKDNVKIIDASGKALGRLASEAAVSLIGKTNPSYVRHIYAGSKVKVVNSSKLKITEKKLGQIFHARYSGHRGGLAISSGAEIKLKKGTKELVRLAILSMLPDNKLKKKMMKNLQIED